MAYVKWVAGLVLLGLVVAFFHFYLPQRDIVRITNIDVTRMDAGTDANGNARTRDVRFIYAMAEGEEPMEYRNDDTGWGFPWYFKFDEAELANRASNAISTGEAPKWVVVRHYGWRVPMLDMFPNALSMRDAEGSDEGLFPWFNVIFLGTLIIAVLAVRRVLIILRRRHVDPVVAAIDEEIDDTAGWWRRQWRRVTGRKKA